MIISDLNYLESAAATSIKGEGFSFYRRPIIQKNISIIVQNSSANAGNGSLFSKGNIAYSSNYAIVTQVNAL